MSSHQPGRRLWRTVPIVVLAVVGLSLIGCQSKTHTSATPPAQLSGTAIPMMTIVTPTPGLPPAPGVTAVATQATQQVAAGSNGSYTVQPGDTLFAIAAKFNVTINALMQANSITDPAALQTNQVLVIP